MKLTDEQRVARQNVIKANIRTYFGNGEGAAERRIRFLKWFLTRSFYWAFLSYTFISACALSTITIGFGHEMELTELHAWMVSTPVDQVIARTHALVMRQLGNCLFFGLSMGMLHSLIRIAHPELPRFRDLLPSKPNDPSLAVLGSVSEPGQSHK